MKWLVLGLLLLPNLVLAEASEGYRLDGFVSARATIANEATQDIDKELDFKKQNVIGVQLTGILSDTARVTVLTTSKVESDYELSVDWVYLTYILPQDWLVNVGRLGIPYYLYSDVKDIGFTHDWMFLPKSVYRFTYSIIDGVSVYHNRSIGDVNTTFQAMYGNYEGNVIVVGLPARSKLDQFIGGFGSIEWNDFYIRVAVSRTNADVQPEALKPVFSNLPDDIIDAFWVNGVDSYFRGIALRYRYDRFTFLSEYVSVDIRDSFFGKRNGAYASLSYCMGEWRPYVMIEHEDFDVTRNRLTDYIAVIPRPIYQVMEGLVDFEKRRKTTYHIGARYDYNSQSAFKVQVSQEYDQRNGGDKTVISLGVDVVF